jgi:DNA-directed RNA polymerase subunit RPC12/RpoP
MVYSWGSFSFNLQIGLTPLCLYDREIIRPHGKYTRLTDTDMETNTRCPFCDSPDVRLREAMLRVRVVPVVGGGPWEDRAFLVFRCLTCGRGFDETEIEAGYSPTNGRGCY